MSGELTVERYIKFLMAVQEALTRPVTYEISADQIRNIGEGDYDKGLAKVREIVSLLNKTRGK